MEDLEDVEYVIMSFLNIHNVVLTSESNFAMTWPITPDFDLELKK